MDIATFLNDMPPGTPVILTKAYHPFSKSSEMPVGTTGIVTERDTSENFVAVCWDFNFGTEKFNEVNKRGLIMEHYEVDTV